MNEISDHLHLDALTISGRSVGENIEGKKTVDERVIGSLEKPIKGQNALRILKGNLAPGGAIIKPSAASPHLLHHVGRAVVFESAEDLAARIDDPELDVDENSVLVLKGICQTASKTDPGSASNFDPPYVIRGGQRSPGRSWSGLRSPGERGCRLQLDGVIRRGS